MVAGGTGDGEVVSAGEAAVCKKELDATRLDGDGVAADAVTVLDSSGLDSVERARLADDSRPGEDEARELTGDGSGLVLNVLALERVDADGAGSDVAEEPGTTNTVEDLRPDVELIIVDADTVDCEVRDTVALERLLCPRELADADGSADRKEDTSVVGEGVAAVDVVSTSCSEDVGVAKKSDEVVAALGSMLDVGGATLRVGVDRCITVDDDDNWPGSESDTDGDGSTEDDGGATLTKLDVELAPVEDDGGATLARLDVELAPVEDDGGATLTKLDVELAPVEDDGGATLARLDVELAPVEDDGGATLTKLDVETARAEDDGGATLTRLDVELAPVEDDGGATLTTLDVETARAEDDGGTTLTTLDELAPVEDDGGATLTTLDVETARAEDDGGATPKEVNVEASASVEDATADDGCAMLRLAVEDSPGAEDDGRATLTRTDVETDTDDGWLRRSEEIDDAVTGNVDVGEATPDDENAAVDREEGVATLTPEDEASGAEDGRTTATVDVDDSIVDDDGSATERDKDGDDARIEEGRTTPMELDLVDAVAVVLVDEGGAMTVVKVGGPEDRRDDGETNARVEENAAEDCTEEGCTTLGVGLATGAADDCADEGCTTSMEEESVGEDDSAEDGVATTRDDAEEAKAEDVSDPTPAEDVGLTRREESNCELAVGASAEEEADGVTPTPTPVDEGTCTSRLRELLTLLERRIAVLESEPLVALGLGRVRDEPSADVRRLLAATVEEEKRGATIVEETGKKMLDGGSGDDRGGGLLGIVGDGGSVGGDVGREGVAGRLGDTSGGGDDGVLGEGGTLVGGDMGRLGVGCSETRDDTGTKADVGDGCCDSDSVVVCGAGLKELSATIRVVGDTEAEGAGGDNELVRERTGGTTTVLETSMEGVANALDDGARLDRSRRTDDVGSAPRVVLDGATP